MGLRSSPVACGSILNHLESRVRVRARRAHPAFSPRHSHLGILTFVANQTHARTWCEVTLLPLQSFIRHAELFANTWPRHSHLEVIQTAVALGVVADEDHLQRSLRVFYHSWRHHNRGHGVLSLIVQLHPPHNAASLRELLLCSRRTARYTVVKVTTDVSTVDKGTSLTKLGTVIVGHAQSILQQQSIVQPPYTQRRMTAYPNIKYVTGVPRSYHKTVTLSTVKKQGPIRIHQYAI